MLTLKLILDPKTMKKTYAFLASAFLSILSAASALANDNVPQSWQLNLTESFSPLGSRAENFHDMLLYIIFGISIFVILLVFYVIFRFNKKANPEPSKTTHNVLLEVVWTIIPIGILIMIAIPSFQLLFYQQKIPDIDMTVKATGYQWYWGYEYPDHDNINFLAYMIPDEEIDASKGQKRLLETDNQVVLPINKNIRLLLTAADVIHSWTIPGLGVKKDAVPGRLNETWFRIEKPGIYYGQCSEICGTGHSYMPITIRAVTQEEFDAWLVKAKEEFASNDNSISTQGTQTALK